MSTQRKFLIAGCAAVLAAAGGVGVAVATDKGGDDDATEQAIPQGSALDRAKSVALHEVGEGRVTATEIRDEEGYYEVEVTKDDGHQVDVHLTRDFDVIDSQGDHGDGSGENEGSG